MYRVEFKVSGSNPFPVDMLRYDACFPVDGESVRVIEKMSCEETCREFARAWHEDARGMAGVFGMGPFPTVKLARYVDSRANARATAGRWSSFGWAIVAGSEHVSKV